MVTPPLGKINTFATTQLTSPLHDFAWWSSVGEGLLPTGLPYLVSKEAAQLPGIEADLCSVLLVGQLVLGRGPELSPVWKMLQILGASINT